MQTFLPFADFEKSSASLDQKRLGKQRVEAYQILLQLCGIKMVDYPIWEPRRGRWNHPAMAMWAGHEVQLFEYIRACCTEWTGRGYKDTCLEKSRLVLEIARKPDWTDQLPSWIGTEEVHKSHRSNLLRKDLEFYASKFPEDIPSDGVSFLECVWPKTEYVLQDRMEANYESSVTTSR